MGVRVSAGSYYSVASPIHALDPRVKLTVAVAFMVSCLAVDDIATLAVAGAFCIGSVLAARVPLGRLLAQIRPVIAFLVLTSVLNLVFVHTGELVFALGPLELHTGGIAAAALYTLRFLLLLLMGALLMLTTQAMALTDAAERLLAPLERTGVPVGELCLVLSIALRFVPTLAREARHIAVAQTARGAALEGKGAVAYARECIPLVVPLFASALRHAEHLARAMDARCYTGGAGRTHYHALRFDARHDGAAVAAAVLYLVALALLKTLF